LKIEYIRQDGTYMETTDYEIPDRNLELLARLLLPQIKEFFADEEAKKEFELWQAQREKGIAKTEK